MSSAEGAELWVVRHGETEWSRDGRHTSTTDLPLTDVGELAAVSLATRLAEVEFDLVLTSPRRRARRTAELAGFPEAQVDEDLVEWGYGDYEGVTTAEIRETVPGWTVWTHPSPGGESADEVSVRLDRVVERTRRHGRSLVFAHGHSLRVLTARWLEQPADEGRFFKLDTSTISVLGFEREHPALLKWNS
ncbi:histidine phosphatase family protein [Nocardioides sp. zg-1308]|uniref:histidine phosphatase family protein n=1 Tax=Nocardioides sp. zg-1308 TaxID=2736253 RepID=UPI001557D330|nr:histidine phosphatase family protein [Nocardioides sp. zg-1308]NPD05585.1 histidine phosphatase family protein [Nocardioides sp. zg-1308]